MYLGNKDITTLLRHAAQFLFYFSQNAIYFITIFSYSNNNHVLHKGSTKYKYPSHRI
jgi:hypothetical protein